MTSNLVPELVVTTAAGAVAGNVTVTGISTRDKLVSVINLADGLDLTSEFSITAANTINNAEGSSTATDRLLVTYYAADSRGGDLNRA